MTGERPRRVAVIGGSGSGKTTFSRALATRLELPCIELDALHWLPNWIEADDEDFRASVEAATAGTPGWVIDGNYARLHDLTVGRADTIVWLDLPMAICLWRVLRRAVTRAYSGEVLWGTNREQWRMVVGRQSLAWWVITTHRRRRRDNTRRLAELAAAGRHVHRFRSTASARRWLASV